MAARAASVTLDILPPFSVDGIDADERYAEIAQAVEQPVQLGLVGEGAGERADPAAGVELEVLEAVGDVLTEASADDHPVALRRCAVDHGPKAGRGAGGSSPPAAQTTRVVLRATEARQKGAGTSGGGVSAASAWWSLFRVRLRAPRRRRGG